MAKKHTANKKRGIIKDIISKLRGGEKRKTKGHSRLRPISEKVDKIEGFITMTPGGFGFVTPLPTADDSEKRDDVFIPVKFVGQAMDGDKVRVALLPKRPGGIDEGRGPAGQVIEILERGRDTVVGELLSGHKVRPLSKRINEDIIVSGGMCGAKRGDWVEVKLLQTEKDGFKRGIVSRNIGKAGTIKSDLDAVKVEYNLPDPYSQARNRDAADLPRQEISRTDLTGLITATIDPQDAKDFDDALSISPGQNPDEVELGVHIADVAAWITRGSEFDKEARLRSFTAYLPGRTLPMLPRDLTALISLTEGTISPAHTVMFTVNSKTGKITGFRRFHSLIKVDRRLSYDQVQEFIDSGKKPGDWSPEFTAAIKQLLDISRKMRRLRKHEEKFLEITTTEIRILCDEKTEQILGIVRHDQREADQIVEECMLAANSAVAAELIERNIPGVYRVHGEPNPDKLEEFSALMSSAFELSTGLLLTREEMNKFLESIEDGPQKPLIMNAFLRSLPRAMYSAEDGLHFGLGKMKYAHFTSPIRRYPDLAVHQQLWALDSGGHLRSNKKFAELAESCTEKEFNNDEAWFSANDRLKLRYLQQQLDDNPNNELLHNGMVNKVNKAGLIVEIGRAHV